MKKISSVALFLISFHSFMVFAQVGKNSAELVAELTEKIKNFKQCDQSKVWPGYDWDKNIDNFIFSSTNQKKTYIFDYHTLAVSSLNYADTPSFAKSTYTHKEVDGKSYVSYLLDSGKGLNDARSILALAFHENFHFFGQDHIKSGEEGRGNLYPYNSQPRIYRAMVNSYLAQALKKPRELEQNLKKASYWNNLHKAEFPEDYIQSGRMDMMEGSAMYAEVISLILSHNNCQYDREVLLQLFFQDDKIYDFYKDTESDNDGQSYLGGMLAYLIEDTLFSNKYDLKNKAAHGIQPIDYLLSQYSPEKTEINQRIKNVIEESYKKDNAEAQAVVDDFSMKKSLGWKLVSYSGALKTDGSFSLSNFINVSEQTYGFYQVMDSFSGSIKIPGLKLRLKGTHIFKTTKNQCGENQNLFWIEAQPEEAVRVLTLKSEQMNFESSNFSIEDGVICLK